MRRSSLYSQSLHGRGESHARVARRSHHLLLLLASSAILDRGDKNVSAGLVTDLEFRQADVAVLSVLACVGKVTND